MRSVLASNVGKICDNLPDDVLPNNIQTVTLNLLQDEDVRRRLEERLRTPDPTKCAMFRRGFKTGDVLLSQMFTFQAKNSKGEDITVRGAPFQVYITLTDKPKAKNEKKAKREPTEEDDEDDSSSMVCNGSDVIKMYGFQTMKVLLKTLGGGNGFETINQKRQLANHVCSGNRGDNPTMNHSVTGFPFNTTVGLGISGEPIK